jgi:hypothetical protein
MYTADAPYAHVLHTKGWTGENNRVVNETVDALIAVRKLHPRKKLYWKIDDDAFAFVGNVLYALTSLRLDFNAPLWLGRMIFR